MKDQRTSPAVKLPPPPEPDRILFHWSPKSNRRSIQRLGLDVGRKTLQGDWRPPFVCLSDEPMLAWMLSGRLWPHIGEWDLWTVNLTRQTSFDHYEVILDTFPDTGRHYVKEYRVYSRIYKRDVEYLATRTAS